MSGIDYESLLRRYMDGVECCEGTDFVRELIGWNVFSDEEARVLLAMSDANHAEHKAKK